MLNQKFPRAFGCVFCGLKEASSEHAAAIDPTQWCNCCQNCGSKEACKCCTCWWWWGLAECNESCPAYEEK